jgi:hypothetical protein
MREINKNQRVTKGIKPVLIQLAISLKYNIHVFIILIIKNSL